eukprot:6184252-Pleurochrysis_carterae.AAC.1
MDKVLSCDGKQLMEAALALRSRSSSALLASYRKPITSFVFGQHRKCHQYHSNRKDAVRLKKRTGAAARADAVMCRSCRPSSLVNERASVESTRGERQARRVRDNQPRQAGKRWLSAESKELSLRKGRGTGRGRQESERTSETEREREREPASEREPEREGRKGVSE